MATTTNYSWSTPDDTALVKDGAAAIRSLGTAIDTTVFNNAGAAIAKTIVDAKGDIIAATAADTVSRLAVGANDTILTADSSTATGLKWAASPSGAMTLLETLTLTGSSTTSSTLSTSYKQFFLYIKNAYNSTNAQLRLRFNGDSGSNYSYGLVENGGAEVVNSQTQIRICNIGTTSSGQNSTNAFVTIMIPSQTDEVFVASQGQTEMSGIRTYSTTGVYDSSAAITTINFTPNSGTFSGGTVYIYGVN